MTNEIEASIVGNLGVIGTVNGEASIIREGHTGISYVLSPSNVSQHVPVERVTRKGCFLASLIQL